MQRRKPHSKPEMRKKKRKRMNFQDYLAMETQQNAMNAEEEEAYQRRLAKKLNLKRGKLDDLGDNMADLLGDFTDSGKENGDQSDVNSHEEEEEEEEKEEDEEEEDEEEEESNSDSELEVEVDDSERQEQEIETAKYVPPHQRTKSASEDEVRLKRRVKGLLNRLSEDNVESVTSEIADMFQTHSRRLITDVLTDHVLESCASGPRGNEQYAVVFAACIAGISGLVGMDFGANFTAGLASCFEKQYEKQDGLSVRNLTLLVSALYYTGLISSDLVFDLLQHLCKRFDEIDVATILHLIQSCGMGLRNQDPASMKEFIISVHERTNELKRATTAANEALSKRVEFMLEAICEIKNNKRRATDEAVRHARMKKWLQKLKIEDVQLRCLTWRKLLDPAKKGQWWLGTATDDHPLQDVPRVVDLIDSGAAEAEKLLKLAAGQRMNTDARRAIFSIVMSSEDYIDAFEKLLRLNLTGKQDREIVRVIVECCLQEKVFNKYYALLASKVCHHEKNHRFTLQYCIWDHFKELSDMEVRRSVNLAKFLAFVVGSSALSLTVLKPVEFGDSRTMTPKSILHFRTFFEAFLRENDDGCVAAAFSRIASSPELASLKSGLVFFLRKYVLHKLNTAEDLIMQRRCSLAKKALSASTSVSY